MYKLSQNSTSITRLSDGASIPADPRNTDYAAYIQWLTEGNTPTPYVKPPGEIIAEAASAQLAVDTLTVKTDPAVTAMLLLSPAEQSTALDTMTTLPQLRAEVKRLAMVVAILAKKLL